MLSEYRESHLNPSVEPTWNEVLTTYEDFLASARAVLVPARDGRANPKTLAAALSAVDEMSARLGRRMPTLLIRTDAGANRQPITARVGNRVT